MNRILRIAAITGAATLLLAACSDETKLDDRVVDGATPSAGTEEMVTVFEPLKRTYKLRPEQQERRDKIDLAAFQQEYGRARDEIAAAEAGPATAGKGAAKAESQGLRPREEMDFAFLDRDSDGKLTLAEYAVWAVPISADQPGRSDKTKPYLSADEVNRAANSFVFYDMDDDGFLQPGEFAVFTVGRSTS